MKVRRALISVSDKTGLKELVEALDRLGIKIMSTGGTAKEIASFGIPVEEIASYTGFPEMLGGRVKTLHPKVHAGFLALRNNKEHMKQIKENDIFPIDMVVVNLYPFEKTISGKNVSFEDALENIDIGGPAMLRSAAKNFKSVAVISSVSQYKCLISELENNNCEFKESTLKRLAAEAFGRTSRYDGIITDYLSGGSASENGAGKKTEKEGGFPDVIKLELHKFKKLRYGENPHQKAAFYRNVPFKGLSLADTEQIQGKELSFNNMLDINSAVEIIKDFNEAAVSIVKHSNPCGAAAAGTLRKAYLDALDCDRMSAFGGVMAFNKPIDGHLAETILNESDFVECIIAPEYKSEAISVFSSKKNLRILKLPSFENIFTEDKDLKRISGGILFQDMDVETLSRRDVKVVTKAKPPEKLWDSLMFGWKIVKYVKSNAIVLCQGTKTVGIGAGQMSRIDSVKIAVQKAGERAGGAVLASDAFFPKTDSIEKAHETGISAIIQPGGSIRDKEIIAACNCFNIPMIFTGIRHFRH